MRLVTHLLAAVSLPVLSFAAEPALPAKTVKLLTIGNSFSANATKHLGHLAKAGGVEFIHKPIVVGGASLELHAKKFEANERDPADQAGLYASGRGLKQFLEDDRWDYVTIQQASIKSHDLGTYQPFAGQLHAAIQKYAPQAKLLVHQTWAYRSDDPRFATKSPKAKEPANQEEMYRGLTNAYHTIAKELSARRIPVGDAFFAADRDPKWGYRRDEKFDFKNAMPPALPDQTHSLHVGWSWKKDKAGVMKLSIDGHHANTAGEYLGACAWYEALFGKSVVGNSYIPGGLDPAYARFLQETAHAAVSKAEAAK